MNIRENCPRANHRSLRRGRSIEPASMNTGRPATNCTLQAVASFRAQPHSSRRICTSSVATAASASMEIVHS